MACKLYMYTGDSQITGSQYRPFKLTHTLLLPRVLAIEKHVHDRAVIHMAARRAGIACVVPPKGWAPPFALEKGTNGLSAESFRFLIRRQLTSHLCMRLPNTSTRRKAAAAGRYAAVQTLCSLRRLVYHTVYAATLLLYAASSCD